MPDRALNVFALILLAFPFYLAINGRLIAYTDLAKGSPAAGSGGPSTGSITPLPPLATLQMLAN